MRNKQQVKYVDIKQTPNTCKCLDRIVNGDESNDRIHEMKTQFIDEDLGTRIWFASIIWHYYWFHNSIELSIDI